MIFVQYTIHKVLMSTSRNSREVQLRATFRLTFKFVHGNKHHLTLTPKNQNNSFINGSKALSRKSIFHKLTGASNFKC